MIEIEVDEEAVHLVCKYTRKTPSEAPIIFGRIVREWYLSGVKAWLQDRNLVPMERKIPEDRITKIGIDSEIAKRYRLMAKTFNLSEAFLTSWLSWMFIQTFKLKQKGDSWRTKKW